jgi:hypothetical protein
LVRYIYCLYCSSSGCCCSSLLDTLHLMYILQLICVLLLKFIWYATFNVFIAADSVCALSCLKFTACAAFNSYLYCS